MGCEIIVISKLRAAKVLVVGAGITGAAVERVLTEYGAIVFCVDESAASKVRKNVIELEEALNSEFDFAVVSPGWKPSHPLIQGLRKKAIPIQSEIDLAWEIKEEINPSQKWLGVTGTNGKTTTVELTAAILQSYGLSVVACGNVGDTAVNAVTDSVKYDYLVVELSSFQLEWSNLPYFHSCAILNIADDHVDWHGSFSDYVSAKLRILDRTGLAILNGDDEVVVEKTSHWSGKKVFYSVGSPSPGELGVVEDVLIDRAFVADPMEAQVISDLDDVHPKAAHAVSNTLAAAGLARSIGVPHEVIHRVIREFRTGRHRIEVVLEDDDVVWINDSKATNPHAAAASLKAFASVIWIAGGLAKGANMRPLITQIKSRVKVAILIGQDCELIASELAKQAPEIKVVRVEKSETESNSLMEAVVLEAKRHVVAGDTVLLAPACASMDQFISYADRGDQFRDAVRKLVK